MELKPIIDAVLGEYFPTINDCSAESAEWFMMNGQTESAKRVIRNLETWGQEMTDEMLAANAECVIFEADTKRFKEERDLMTRSFDQSQDRVLKYSNDLTEMDERYAELYANFQDLAKDYRRMQNSHNDAVIVADSVSSISGRRFKENNGLRKSYGVVKRKMLALKRKVKEMTEVIYSQAQTIEDLKCRIEDLERENAELECRNSHNSYYASILGK